MAYEGRKDPFTLQDEYYSKLYRHSLSVTPFPIICPPLPLQLLGSSALSICPAVKAYISVTMSWILMKLDESVET